MKVKHKDHAITITITTGDMIDRGYLRNHLESTLEESKIIRDEIVPNINHAFKNNLDHIRAKLSKSRLIDNLYDLIAYPIIERTDSTDSGPDNAPPKRRF